MNFIASREVRLCSSVQNWSTEGANTVGISTSRMHNYVSTCLFILLKNACIPRKTTENIAPAWWVNSRLLFTLPLLGALWSNNCTGDAKFPWGGRKRPYPYCARIFEFRNVAKSAFVTRQIRQPCPAGSDFRFRLVFSWSG